MRKISGCFVVVFVCIICLCVNVNANNGFYKIKRGKSIKIEKLIGKEKVKSVNIKGLHHIKCKNKRIYALHKGRASIFINNKKYVIEVVGRRDVKHKNRVFIQSGGRYNSKLKYIKNGNIVHTIRSGETLISNKNKLYVNSSRKYNVVAIGMVKPLEYYILVAGSYRNEMDTNKGITLNEARDILYSKGCIYAKDLDGGGSLTLVYNGKVVNNLVDGIERPVCDFIYFVN